MERASRPLLTANLLKGLSRTARRKRLDKLKENRTKLYNDVMSLVGRGLERAATSGHRYQDLLLQDSVLEQRHWPSRSEIADLLAIEGGFITAYNEKSGKITITWDEPSE